MERRNTIGVIALLFLLSTLSVCSPTGDEPEAVELVVATSDKGLDKCTNDLGWTIQVTDFRLAIRDLEFTIEGETHAGLRQELFEILVPKAYAHAGHYAGGDVTGELPGNFILDLTDDGGRELGNASLLVGDYHGVNFTFRNATEKDDLNDDDPLLGCTAVIKGEAKRDTERVEYTARLKVSKDTQMVGGPFELEVDEQTSAKLMLRVFTIDPSEKDTLFDGIDFSELDDGDDGEVAINSGDPAHNILIKTLMRHDHYGIHVE